MNVTSAPSRPVVYYPGTSVPQTFTKSDGPALAKAREKELAEVPKAAIPRAEHNDGWSTLGLVVGGAALVVGIPAVLFVSGALGVLSFIVLGLTALIAFFNARPDADKVTNSAQVAAGTTAVHQSVSKKRAIETKYGVAERILRNGPDEKTCSTLPQPIGCADHEKPFAATETFSKTQFPVRVGSGSLRFRWILKCGSSAEKCGTACRANRRSMAH